MKIHFNILSLRNFLSYGNNTTLIILDKPGTTLIVGEDLDNTTEGTGGNGCGKSSIVNAIVYALYDKPISNISKDKLVNNINNKDLEVIVEFQIDDKHFKIKRERKSKSGAAGNNVYFWINGEDKTLDSVVNTNKYIEQCIGITYDLFIRIVTFSAALEPFLMLPKPEQATMFEKLVGLTSLSDKATELKELIKETETDIKFKKTKIELLEQEHKRHTIQIEHAKERMEKWEITSSEDILKHSSKLKDLSDINFDDEQETHQQLEIVNNQLSRKITLRQQLHKELKELNNLQTKLAKINEIDFEYEQELYDKINTTDETITTNQSTIKTLVETIKKNNEQITKYTNELTHLSSSTCPYCLQQYKDKVEKVKEVEQQLLLIEQSTQKLSDDYSLLKVETDVLLKYTKVLTSSLYPIPYNELTQLKYEKDNIQEKIDELLGVKQELQIIEDTVVILQDRQSNYLQQLTTTTLKELLELKNAHTILTTKINDLQKTTNPHLESYDELVQIKLEKIDYDDVNKLTKVIEHQKLLLKLLTKKDSFVRRALLNKYIPYLNTRLQYFLTELGLKHKVTFTHEMTANISQFGRMLDFGNLSAGQQARVNLALSLAFSDVLQNLHAKINICMLDEVLDIGLDAIGVQAAAKLLKKKTKDEGISMYIISHRDEIGGIFDHKMIIQLIKGFSYVKDNDIV